MIVYVLGKPCNIYSLYRNPIVIIGFSLQSVNISGSLDFIVCVQCCRMVDSVPIISIVANTVRPSVDTGEIITPA